MAIWTGSVTHRKGGREGNKKDPPNLSNPAHGAAGSVLVAGMVRGCCGETTFELPLDREQKKLASVLQEPLVVQECTSCFHRIPMSGTRCTSFFPQHVCLWVSLTSIPERQSLQGRKHSFPHPSVHQTVARRKHPWEMGWGARHLPIEVRGGVGGPPASADRSEGWGGPYNLFHTPQFHRIPMSGCKTYDYSWDALRFS